MRHRITHSHARHLLIPKPPRTKQVPRLCLVQRHDPGDSPIWAFTARYLLTSRRKSRFGTQIAGEAQTASRLMKTRPRAVNAAMHPANHVIFVGSYRRGGPLTARAPGLSWTLMGSTFAGGSPRSARRKALTWTEMMPRRFAACSRGNPFAVAPSTPCFRGSLRSRRTCLIPKRGAAPRRRGVELRPHFFPPDIPKP